MKGDYLIIQGKKILKSEIAYIDAGGRIFMKANFKKKTPTPFIKAKRPTKEDIDAERL